MTYTILTQSRKSLANQLQMLTGLPVHYAGAPTFAYHIGDYTLTLHTMEVENPDPCIIQNLTVNGFIENPLQTEPQEANVSEDEPEVDQTPEPAEAPSEAQENATCDDDDNRIQLEVAVPLEGHTYESLANIVYTIYSRGKLLSKSMCGFFFASDKLVDYMRTSEQIHTVAQAIHIITNAKASGDLVGLRIDEPDDTTGDKAQVVFDGCGISDNADTTHAWVTLIAHINKSCLEHKRILARQSEEANEKFTMRVWITRLGMAGPEFKKYRNILYRNLSGHTAFRTQECADRWKAKHQPKGEKS